MKHQILVAVFATITFGSYTQAAVIVDDAALIDSPFSSPNKLLTLTQSIPPGEGLFSIEVEAISTSQYNFNYAGIAEEYALFFANSGEEFTPTVALTDTPLVSNNGVDPGTTLVTFSPGQTRFFAYWDDRNFDSIPDVSDIYGWVTLQRSGSVLNVGASATAQGGGIVVGTTTQIPEPSAATLVCLGTLAFCLLWREKI